MKKAAHLESLIAAVCVSELTDPFFQNPEGLLGDTLERAFHDRTTSLLRDRDPRFLAVDLDHTLFSVWEFGDQQERLGSNKAESGLRAGPTLIRNFWDALPSRLQRTRLTDWWRGQWPYCLEVRILAAPAPGFFGVLKALHDLNWRLALVTASERDRVDFFLARMPILSELFRYEGTLQCIAANDLERGVRELTTNSEESAWGRIHRDKAPSLSMKTPLLSRALLGDAFDWLVDDHSDTQKLYAETEATDQLIVSDPRNPSVTAIRVLEALTGNRLESMPEPSSENWHVIEDPLHLPLAIRSLALDPA